MSPRHFPREYLLERPAPPKIEDVHPFPWGVRATNTTDFRGFRETVFVILDARGKCVAECTSQIAAEFIVQKAAP